jgi:hypothetical protein
MLGMVALGIEELLDLLPRVRGEIRIDGDRRPAERGHRFQQWRGLVGRQPLRTDGLQGWQVHFASRIVLEMIPFDGCAKDGT